MKIIKLSYIAILLLLFTSCGDDFLELNPISSASTENFYKTADDIDLALNGAYASLRLSGISLNNYIFGEIRSDNTVPVASGSVTDQDEFDRFYIRTTNPHISQRWDDSYQAIARLNTILQKIDAIEMDESLKQRYISETKFLRGLVYFELVRTFGAVPLITIPVSNADEGYDFGRNPSTEIYAQIIQDLTDAENTLPTTYNDAGTGRATKGAAKALLGRVYMTQRDFPKAQTKLKEVIDLNIYSILPDYEEVFRVGNKNNVESVFDIQFIASEGQGNPWPNSFGPQNSGNAVINFGGQGNNEPTNDLISAYSSDDLRKDISLATSFVNASGNVIPDNYVTKYYDDITSRGDAGNNIPYIRFADVILLYAEALNENGYNPTGEAFTYLNTTRNRAGLTSLTSIDLPNQQSFRLAIEKERRLELAFEGHRWFDLVRTNRAIEVINNAGINLVGNITENNYVFPIPQSQIDINRELITQNPGYN